MNNRMHDNGPFYTNIILTSWLRHSFRQHHHPPYSSRSIRERHHKCHDVPPEASTVRSWSKWRQCHRESRNLAYRKTAAKALCSLVASRDADVSLIGWNDLPAFWRACVQLICRKRKLSLHSHSDRQYHHWIITTLSLEAWLTKRTKRI